MCALYIKGAICKYCILSTDLHILMIDLRSVSMSTIGEGGAWWIHSDWGLQSQFCVDVINRWPLTIVCIFRHLMLFFYSDIGIFILLIYYTCKHFHQWSYNCSKLIFKVLFIDRFPVKLLYLVIQFKLHILSVCVVFTLVASLWRLDYW